MLSIHQMIQNKRILSIIPAREGSKRILNKNILPLGGEPLINWTIKSANASKYIDKAIVSSDSDKIIDIARNAGAEVPFVRPSEFAKDTSSSFVVVHHAIDFFESIGESFDICILLQPTSPFRNHIHIDEALESFMNLNASSLISVTKLNHPLEWANELGNEGQMDKFFEQDFLNIRSQDFPDRYLVNGAIYVFDINKFLQNESYFFSSFSFAYEMNYLDSIDIDTYEDFELCELLLNHRQLDT